MTTVRVFIRLKPERRNPTNDFLFENADTEEGFMLRAPHGRLPDDTEFVSVVMTIDTSGASGRFILFLREVVRRDPDGRLSGNRIWKAWANWNGVAASLRMIEGVDRKDIHDHFRVAFDEDKMKWRRRGGDPEWLWMGYALAPEWDDSATGRG